MNDTPLPLMVSAMNTFGRSVTVANCASASRMTAGSWPSPRRTSQPNVAELVLDRTEVADRRHERVGLELVVIDDDDDLGDLLVGDRLERLPDLPFLQLAVAGHHEHAAAAAGVAIGARHAVGLRDAHAERAGVGRDERRGHIGVARQSVQLPQRVHETRSRASRAQSAANRTPARRAPSTRSRCRTPACRCWVRSAPRSTAR